MIWVILAIAVVTLLITLWLVVQINRIQATISATPADGNVFAMLRKVDNELGHLAQDVANMEPRLASVEARIPLALSYTGIVTYETHYRIEGDGRQFSATSQIGFTPRNELERLIAKAGLQVTDSPYDPRPSLRLSDGRVVEMDGRIRDDFDAIDAVGTGQAKVNTLAGVTDRDRL